MPITNKRIIIHLDLPKAASTFLQQQVFNRFENTAYLGPDFVTLNAEFNQILYKPDTHYKPQQVLEIIREIPQDTVIISRETFSGGLVNNYFRREKVVERFTRLFPYAHFLLCIRNQLDWMASLYHFNRSNGGNIPAEKYYWLENRKGLSLRKYFETQRTGKPLNPAHYPGLGQRHVCPAFILDYYECIRMYKQYTDNLHVFLHEDLKTDTAHVIRRICNIVQKPYHEPNHYVPANVSGASWTIPLQQVARKLARLNIGLGLHERVRAFISRSLPGKRTPFPIELQQQIRERFRENNRKTAEAFPEIGLQRHKKAYFLTDKD